MVSLIDAFVADGRPAREYAVSLVDSHPDAAYNARAAASVARHLIDTELVRTQVRGSARSGRTRVAPA